MSNELTISKSDCRLEAARLHDMDETGGLVVETEENPISLEDDAEKRRAISVIGLTATRRLGERFTKALKIIPELVGAGEAEERLDAGGYVVGFSNKGCGVDNGAHSQEGAMCVGAPWRAV
jgi:hypothetical protein